MGSHGCVFPSVWELEAQTVASDRYFRGQVPADRSLGEDFENRKKPDIVNIRIKITSKPFQICLQSRGDFSLIRAPD